MFVIWEYISQNEVGLICFFRWIALLLIIIIGKLKLIFYKNVKKKKFSIKHKFDCYILDTRQTLIIFEVIL
jgi:hypothetical protein